MQNASFVAGQSETKCVSICTVKLFPGIFKGRLKRVILSTCDINDLISPELDAVW